MKSLIDIKKYSTAMAKVIATVLLKDNGVECYFENASKSLSMSESRSNILEAFKKDVSKTANDLFKAQNIINSIRNGVVTEFNSVYNTIEEVFSSTYNAETQTITLCGVVFSAKGENDMTKQEIETKMLKNLFDINRKQLSAALKSLHKYDDAKDDIEKAILYPSTILADEIIKKISDENIAFGNYRSNMSYEDQLEFDTTFKRTGIDGVIQNATYIDKNGLKQLASSHKRIDSVELEKFLKSGSKYINAVEVDGDGDLQKVSHLLKQVEKLSLNTKVKFTFKARKLGNYKARGLCMTSQRIVAEDVRDTSAVLHEIAHHIHLITLNESRFVNYMISKLAPLVVLDEEMSDSKKSYYLEPTEIVARACEIASLFAKEEGRLVIDDNDFEIIKSREYYTLYEGIYFNFNAFNENLKEEMLNLFRLFFETSLDADENVISDFDNFIKIDTEYTRVEKELGFYELMKREAKKVDKEKKALYSFVTYQNIETIFANKGKVSVTELVRNILVNWNYLGGHKDRMTVPEWRDVIEDKSGVLMYLFDTVKDSSSTEEWNDFLVDFRTSLWSKVRSTILLYGFRGKFEMALRRSFRENETPNRARAIKFLADIDKTKKVEKTSDVSLELVVSIEPEKKEEPKAVKKEAPKPKVSKNDDFEALIESGEIVEFERTDDKGIEKVLKIENKISDFKSFNQYMRSKRIGYYSRIARGFILYKEYVEKALSDNKNVAAATATALYSADMLQKFANGTLF